MLAIANAMFTLIFNIKRPCQYVFNTIIVLNVLILTKCLSYLMNLHKNDNIIIDALFCLN